MKIILIDDYGSLEIFQEILNRYFSPNSIVFAPLSQAWEKVKIEHPDLVIINNSILENEVELIKEINKIDENIQVILYLPSNSQLTTSMPENLDVFIIKNFNTREIILQIRNIIKIREKLKDFQRKRNSMLDKLERTRMLLDNSPDWEHLLDRDGNSVYVSSSCQNITGYIPKDFLQHAELLKEIIHPDDLPLFNKHLREAFITHKDQNLSLEFRIIARSGKERWINHLCHPFYDPDGKFWGRWASNRDITEKKLLEKALENSESTLRLITDNMIDLISQTDTNGIFQYISHSHTKVLGYLPEDLLGRSAFGLLHPEDVLRIKTMFQKGIKEKKEERDEYRFRHAKGHYVWVETIGKLLEDERGNINGAIFSSRDISQRKKAEDERNRIFNLSMDILGTADFQGYFHDLSPACKEILGYDTEELSSFSFVELVHPDDLEATQNDMNDLAKGKPVYNLTNRYRCKDGSYRWLSWNSIPYIKDKLIYFVARDVTNIKRAEEELKKSHKQIEQKVHEKTSELVKSNQQLKYEIKERKKAEKDRLKAYNKLQRALEGTVQAMGRVVDKRDPYTAGHQQRVARLAQAIAKEMGLESEKLEGLRLAAEIHDIGKINIPAEILSKPDKLDEIEFNMIKNHPEVGYEIIKDIKFPCPVGDIILQHHEKLDGSGYPAGLSGKEILLEAKILCVADVVEAMSFHRPYRPALGIETALEEINQNKGTLFDEEVVDACIKLFKNKGFVLS